MLRDNLVGLIEPMLSSAGAYPLALSPEWNRSSDDRPPCLENPRPEGAESTLTENALSPFHAEPKHYLNPQPLGNRIVHEYIWGIGLLQALLSFGKDVKYRHRCLHSRKMFISS